MNSSLPSDDSIPNDSPSDASSSERTADSTSTTAGPFVGTPVQTMAPLAPALSERDLRSESTPMWLPVLLLVATCVSTFVAGAMSWEPSALISMLLGNGYISAEAGQMDARQTVLRHAGQGAIYMSCIIAILFAHEMGHYVATRIYKIPSSLPFFIPFPIAPVGTMGAVIAMKGQRANRKEIFDIGIAGPLAGLVLAIPIVWYGVAHLDITQPRGGSYRYHLPLLVQWMYAWMNPDSPVLREVYSSQMNATFMAGWVGLLITGLNMLPVSQLDGGHVTYTMFGSFSRWIARAFIVSALAYMVITRTMIWTLMLLLVFFIGLYHPPTSDDSVPLGRGRMILGAFSLLIPVLCFPPKGLIPVLSY